MKKVLSLVLCLFFLLPGVLCFAESTPQPVSEPAPPSESVVERAYQELGKPYVWGAAGPAGYDASGLVIYCLTGDHKMLGTTTTFMTWPLANDPQPGDICVSETHCGIFIGGAQMIHAPTFGYPVQISSVQSDMKIVRYPGEPRYADTADEPDGTGTDTYLYLDGIEGECTAPNHDKWIDVIYCYPSYEPQEIGSGRGVAEKIKLKRLVDNASLKLSEHYMKGTTIKTGKIHYCRQNGGQQEVVYAIQLEDIKVTRLEIGVEDLPDGSFQLVETVEMKADRTTWTENIPLPEDLDRTEIEPEAPIELTEIERIRALLDDYDNPAVKAKLNAVPGYTEWIAQLRARLAELEREERENADSKDSNLSPATGIIESKDDLFATLMCMGLAVIGLMILLNERRKEQEK